jgi:hypothetical protein
MTLQLLHSEFPYIYEENLIFFFISVHSHSQRKNIPLPPYMAVSVGYIGVMELQSLELHLDFGYL